MSVFSHWLCFLLCFISAGFCLWTLHSRGKKRENPPLPLTQPSDIEAEDALKAVYQLDEQKKQWDQQDLSAMLGITGHWIEGLAVVLIDFGWAQKDGKGVYHLTEKGKRRARELIRAHRLLEKYLFARKGMSIDRVHDEAHRMEHEITLEELEKLDDELGYPAWDPHGQFIPELDGATTSLPKSSLSDAWKSATRMRIVSLNDEYSPFLAQLVALGLTPGVDIELVDRKQNVLLVRVEEKEIPLAEAAANHIFVAPSPIFPVPLGELLVGSRAQVVDIKGGGKHQRRMLDMGFVPGAEIDVMRRAPLGDPVEYRIKGTAVALRQIDADTIMVEELNG
ncbi:metal-dependent transcriptional regulator [candidate division KSB1 bacterium]|nr:metal-dependent transcriptional regulator [candidate division KSB1 bacterium]